MLAELRARQQERVDVHAVGVERQARRLHLLVVDRHEHEIDVGLRPHRVVRQAAAQDRREDAAIVLELLDQRVERDGEVVLDGPVIHATSPRTEV